MLLYAVCAQPQRRAEWCRAIVATAVIAVLTSDLLAVPALAAKFVVWDLKWPAILALWATGESVGDMCCGDGSVLPWAPAAAVTNVACDCSCIRSSLFVAAAAFGIATRRCVAYAILLTAYRPRVRRGLLRHTACRGKYPSALHLESNARCCSPTPS